MSDLSKSLHPYVVLLPISNEEKLRYILTLFSSSTIIEILSLFNWDRELCQKNIINTLKHHSNKTVINALKKLVSLGLLHEKERIELRGNRRVKMKCYTLSETGKWYNILFKDIKELDTNLIKKVVTDLSTIFMARMLSFTKIIGINFSEFLKQVVSGSMLGIARTRKIEKLDTVVFGSLALDIYVKPEIRMYAGGSGANVAVVASRLGLKTSFISKVPANFLGLFLLAELIDEGVDVSLTEIDGETELPICIIHETLESPQLICSYGKDSLNLPVLQSVRDEVINVSARARSIYLGEGICRVYEELLGKLSRKYNRHKIIIYRPHKMALKYYLNECLSILKCSPILILNDEKESILKSKGLNIPEDLFNEGVQEIIITKGSKGAILFTKGREPEKIPAPQVNIVDTIGAGDTFSASLIYYLLKGYKLKDAVKKAVWISALSTTQLGPRKNPRELLDKQ